MSKSAELQPNAYLVDAIISALKVQSKREGDVVVYDLQRNIISKTELDSHANMVVLGKRAFIFKSTWRTYNVKPFSSDLGMMENVPIVDGAIVYDFK